MESHPIDPKVSSYIIQVQEEEIKRIAEELHEGVAQTLYSLTTGLHFLELNLKAGLKEQAVPQMKQQIMEMKQTVGRTIDELKRLTTELSPPLLASFGLVPALREYLQVYSSTFGIISNLSSQGEERRCASFVEQSLFRVCQEALFNAAKYADTNQVQLNLTWEKEQLKIEIEDFGVGFDLLEKKEANALLGIKAMKHRLELIRGTLQLKSLLKQGTKVIVTVPL